MSYQMESKNEQSESHPHELSDAPGIPSSQCTPFKFQVTNPWDLEK